MTKMLKTPIITIKGIKRMHGFTIIELLLATSVFSVVLLGALGGFIRTGQLFYKGVTITQTHGVAKQILDDVTSSINNTSASKILTNTSNGYSYICVGSVRYTYNLYRMIDSSQGQSYAPGSGNYGLMRDTVNGCSAPDSSSLGKAAEMLGDRMRLSNFSIAPQGTGHLYTVKATVAYGSDDVLDNPLSNSPNCVGNSQSQQFCAVSSLSTSVFAGF